MSFSLEDLHASTFLEHIHTVFYSRMENGSDFEFELIEVNDISAQDAQKNVAKRQERFCLLFRAVNQQVLPQRIYDLHHPQMGNLSLFLVPVGQDEAGTYYEAVFNRIIPKQS